MKRGISILLIMAVALTLAMAGCGAGEKETVVITATENGWDSQSLHNAIAEFIVENGYEGYEFEVSTGSSTMNWQALIAGDIDLDIESWTDNVATYQDDLANGDVVELGILVPDSAQGLYVPAYVIYGDEERGIEPMAPELKTVADLLKYSDVFPDDEDPSKGRIYGSIPGWMADEILYAKYEYYNLDDKFTYTRLGSEAALFASLASAYNLGDPWVGYCYEPTWITGQLDLILLEDEPYDPELFEAGQCEFPKQALKIVSSKYFAEKAPDLAEFFKKYKTGSELISEALAYLIENQGLSYEQVAVWLLTQHDELLDEWLPAENASNVRAALKSYGQ